MRGRDPPCCLSQNRTLHEHRILRRWLGPWAAGRRETKAQGCCFHLAPPNMTHLSLFVLNLILIIWRLTCLLADGVVLGHSIKGHQASVLSCLQDLGQVFSILNLLFLSLSIDSGTTYVRIQRLRHRHLGLVTGKGCNPVKADLRFPAWNMSGMWNIWMKQWRCQ